MASTRLASDLEEGCSLTVSRNLKKAARRIVQHGFTVYSVEDQDIRQAIAHAGRHAKSFFHHQQATSDKDVPYHEIVNGHLMGYNVPSNAKQVFRAFFDKVNHDKLNIVEPSSLQQPWPNKEMKHASNVLANKLHMLLDDCFEEIVRGVKQSIEAKLESQDHPQETHSRPRHQDTSDCLLTSSNMCPLDYFLYQGRESSTVNCSEHVDRGVLICVCLNHKVAGLEVLVQQDKECFFYCPEQEIIENGSNAQFGEYICIMAGHQLKDAVESSCHGLRGNSDKHVLDSHLLQRLKACVHRVRQDLAGERLSITYEVRLQSTKKSNKRGRAVQT